MKNKKQSGVVFAWDWKEQPPIADIVNAAKEIPKSKLWSFADGSDSIILIVAATKAIAKEVYRSEVEDDTEEDSDRIVISDDDLSLWVDE